MTVLVGVGWESFVWCWWGGVGGVATPERERIGLRGAPRERGLGVEEKGVASV
ncbi:MAG TPA: hypothetical protein VLL52_13730 [Anaerolineae bacterium]|nr:hypothetical protein [Anaerolineae bacterium]